MSSSPDGKDQWQELQLLDVQPEQDGPAELLKLPLLLKLEEDISFFTFPLLHLGHLTFSLELNTSSSNSCPHFPQLYSKIGMTAPSFKLFAGRARGPIIY